MWAESPQGEAECGQRAESSERPSHGGLEVMEELWSQALGAALPAPSPQKAPPPNTQMITSGAFIPTIKTCRVLVIHQKAAGSAIPSRGTTPWLLRAVNSSLGWKPLEGKWQIHLNDGSAARPYPGQESHQSPA